jgi:spore maturation protein CgeB
MGAEYRKALCGAKMCLCFLSKLNRDSYTTRSFEIPACGRLLLSERTADLQRFFREDVEAVFFSTPEELAQKALWLRDHPEKIEAIAQAGMQRVYSDGHSIEDRMKQLLSIIGA